MVLCISQVVPYTGQVGRLISKVLFFPLFFLCSKEHFSIFFVQYLGVTAGIAKFFPILSEFFPTVAELSLYWSSFSVY
jgi:hypothetical protein